jgi:hypothetical protein
VTIPVVSVEEADFRIRDDGGTLHVRPTYAAEAWLGDRSVARTAEGGIAVDPRLLEVARVRSRGRFSA